MNDEQILRIVLQAMETAGRLGRGEAYIGNDIRNIANCGIEVFKNIKAREARIVHKEQ